MGTDLLELFATLGIDTGPFITGITDAVNWATSTVWNFAKDVVGTGLEFDEAMSGVYAVTQTTDEGVQQMLANAAIAEAQISSFTGAEVAMAEYYEGLAGYNTEEIVAGLRGIVVAAEASGESLPLVADILTDVTRAFGDGAAEQEHYADVLAATATNSNTTIGKMGQTLKYVSPVAGSLGYSIEDVAISIGLMADRATKGSQAGTTLRNIFTRIATNAGQTNKDLGALDVVTEKLGVSFYDAAGNARPWIEFLDDAREAWKGLDEQDKTAVLDAYSSFAVKGKDADEVIKNLAEDGQRMDTWLKTWSTTKLESRADEAEKQIRDMAASYKELFDILGMDVDPDSDSVDKLANSLDQARYKLGKMSDQEKIYFSKQIGSMRGMTGWLEMMDASAESYDTLKESIYGAEGAAEQMRDIRMESNLAGDVKSFQAAWDAMKLTIYDDVNGPMRDVVQWWTDAIKDITTAISEDGLAGGIDKLAQKIEEFADSAEGQRILESIGGLIGTVLTGVIEKVVPALATAAPKLLPALLSGFGGEEGANLPIVSQIGGLISNWIKTDMSKGTGSWTGVNQFKETGYRPEVDEVVAQKLTINGVEVSAEEIQAAIDEAEKNNSTIVTIAGLEMDETWANELLKEIDPGMDTIQDGFETKTEDGFTGGAANGAVNMEAIFTDAISGISSLFETDVGDAGTPAGNNFVSKFRDALLNQVFTVNVSANVSGLPTQKNARAMASGRIFNRPTVFGYAEGAYQIAGDAGPEAVVGVSSLSSMITNAVRNAVGAMMPDVIPIVGDVTRPANVVIQLNEAEIGRFFLPPIRAEQQRLGATFTNRR